MQKINVILFLIILSTGCSVLKKEHGLVIKNDMITTDNKLSEELENRNLSNHNYYIQKAEVQIYGNGGDEKILISVKYRKPDQYLISVRNKTGIEAARIFISADTLLLNDRIHRKMYCSSPGYMKRKYGMTLSIIPVLIGDYIEKEGSGFKKTNCVENRIKIDGSVDGLSINYLVDCNIGKSVLSILESSMSSERIEIKNSEFFEVENNIIPGKIEINDYKRESIISIKIKKITFLWDDKIEFIPGNKYEIIELL